jgi:hypothetical protein
MHTSSVRITWIKGWLNAIICTTQEFVDIAAPASCNGHDAMEMIKLIFVNTSLLIYHSAVAIISTRRRAHANWTSCVWRRQGGKRSQY